MPRARLSVNGIDIAKPGYDVDTAGLANMQFSSSLVAARIAKTGVTTPTSFSGYLSDIYLRSIVYLDVPAPKPPVVLVAGLNGDGSTDQTPFVYRSASGGVAYRLPYYEINTFTDRFELYVLTDPIVRPAPASWRYWVFQNTLTT
jgi:hypothetical protein